MHMIKFNKLKQCHLLVEEEEDNVKLQTEMMYVRSEHAVAMETLKADHDRMLEKMKFTLQMNHTEEMTLGETCFSPTRKCASETHSFDKRCTKNINESPTLSVGPPKKAHGCRKDS